MCPPARPPAPPPPPPPHDPSCTHTADTAVVNEPGSVALGATTRSKTTAVLAAGLVGAACVYTAVADPNTSSAFPQCPLRLLTGVDCAMCGGLRAVHALAGGDIVRAASQNLLVVILAPLALWAGAQWFAAQWGRRLPGPPVRPWMAVALAVVAVIYSVVRNLSIGPGPWLHSDTW